MRHYPDLSGYSNFTPDRSKLNELKARLAEREDSAAWWEGEIYNLAKRKNDCGSGNGKKARECRSNYGKAEDQAWAEVAIRRDHDIPSLKQQIIDEEKSIAAQITAFEKTEAAKTSSKTNVINAEANKKLQEGLANPDAIKAIAAKETAMAEINKALAIADAEINKVMAIAGAELKNKKYIILGGVAGVILITGSILLYVYLKNKKKAGA